MQTIALARNAMATRFEILLHGENPVTLRAAGEEALDEIDRLEAQLSLYRSGSEIARVNALGSKEPVRVSPNVFHLLCEARELHHLTGGHFDITIAPLVRCWGFMEGTGNMPAPDDVRKARDQVGMSLVELDSEKSTVHFARDGVMLDLGAIGKGYAIDRAVALLREAGITSALVHGGTSTVYGVGQTPDGEPWKVALEYPKTADVETGRQMAASVSLRDEALSVSAVWGRSFQADGRRFGHVLDPRTGYPVTGTLLAAVVLPSAMETDALSTALLVGGESGHGQIHNLRPKMRTLIMSNDASGGDNYSIISRGIPKVR